MRYLTFTYYKRANGQIDEVMAVAKNLKARDWQMANVLLDFRDQKVLKCSIEGTKGSMDWDVVVSYFYSHYTNIIERLFAENGHELPKEPKPQPTEADTPV